MTGLIRDRGPGLRADTALRRAIDTMWEKQEADGSWRGELAASPVATGAAVIAMRMIDPQGYAATIGRAVDWLHQARHRDGAWGDTHAGPSTLGGTAIALAALRLVEPRWPAEGGLDAMNRLGGRAALEDLTLSPMYAVCQHYLYWAGLWPTVPAHRVPFEVILLPRFLAAKMSFAMPTIASFGIMQSRTGQPPLPRRALDRAAERRALRQLAELIEFEGAGGCFEESAFVAAVVAVALHRAGIAEPVVTRCMNYLLATVRPDGAWPVDRDLEHSCTTYVTSGLQQAGLAADVRLKSTVGWLRQGQLDRPFPMTGAPAGGWGWARPSAWPDTDDTALGISALAGFGLGQSDESVAAGVGWLRSMQSRNGAWSCFVRNGRQELDGPCSVLTAHAVLALHAAAGATRRTAEVARALRWLERAQHPDGSLECLWFRGRTTPTARVLTAATALGLSQQPLAQGCARWLIAHQHADGGWGDGRDRPSSAEETAWAAIALMSLVPGEDEAVTRAIDWLVSRQDPDGTWSPSEVGIYFPELTYWCDHMANGHAIQALARYATDRDS